MGIKQLERRPFPTTVSYRYFIICYVQMIKYWHRIKTSTPKESLILQLINYVEHQETQEHFQWFSTVKFILKMCDLEYVWQDPTKVENGTLVTKCFNYLSKRYVNFWHNRINNDESCCPSKKPTHGGNKLSTYRLIKKDYRMETYLYHISDRDIRRNLTKLRCSNHPLQIEQGRYSQTNVTERLCIACNKIEDEIHFLTECKLYVTVRQKLYKDHSITSTNKDTKEIFIDCMKRNDKLYILDIANFVTACFEIRRIFLSSN